MHTLTYSTREWTRSHTTCPSLPCLPDIPSKILRKRKGICWSVACCSGSWNRRGRSPAVIRLCVTYILNTHSVDKVLKQTLIINLSQLFGYWSVVFGTFRRLVFSSFFRLDSTWNVIVYQFVRTGVFLAVVFDFGWTDISPAWLPIFTVVSGKCRALV